MPRVTIAEQYENGFTLLEALVVVAIGLIVTTIGVPRMSNAIANQKLRASMTSISGLLQNTRMIAVQQNKTKTACHYTRTSVPNALFYFVKDATVCTSGMAPATTDPQVELEAPIVPLDEPTGTGAPPKIDNAVMGFSIDPLTTDPSFNSRGLPCAYAGGTCTTNSPFIQYFRDDRVGVAGGWAAISITSAGRIKRWFWNGSTWTD